jgi:hypothetical protein
MIGIKLIGWWLVSEKLKIVEFPLQDKSAKKIIQDLATNHSHSIRLRQYCKERMRERGVNIRQIFQVLKCPRSRFTERPCQTPRGSYKFNLQGFASGELIEVVIDLHNSETDPEAYVVTVIIK